MEEEKGKQEEEEEEQKQEQSKSKEEREQQQHQEREETEGGSSFVPASGRWVWAARFSSPFKRRRVEIGGVTERQEEDEKTGKTAKEKQKETGECEWGIFEGCETERG